MIGSKDDAARYRVKVTIYMKHDDVSCCFTNFFFTNYSIVYRG